MSLTPLILLLVTVLCLESPVLAISTNSHSLMVMTLVLFILTPLISRQTISRNQHSLTTNWRALSMLMVSTSPMDLTSPILICIIVSFLMLTTLHQLEKLMPPISSLLTLLDLQSRDLSMKLLVHLHLILSTSLLSSLVMDRHLEQSLPLRPLQITVWQPEHLLRSMVLMSWTIISLQRSRT